MTSGVNTKKSVKKIAVLFTDIIGSTPFFKSQGNLAGRKMLQQHEDIVSKEIIEFGGTVVKNIGDSILAYFANPQEATKVAIQIQKEFSRYNNKQKNEKHKIYVRIGIHFDEGIVEETDIFGNAVNIASKVTDLAGSNEIFISHDVFALVNTLSSLEFKSVEIPDNKKALVESAVYQVLWDNSIDFDPTIMSVIYMRPVRKLDVSSFDKLWDNLIKTKALFWNGKIDDETIMDDQSVILIAKKPALVMDVARDVLKFLGNNLNNNKESHILPVQIIIDAGPCPETDRLASEGFNPDWEGFRPGTVFMSPAAYELIKKEHSLSIVPSTSPGADQPQSFHEIALDDYKQKEDELLFLYQDALGTGQNAPCFYCGSKEHAARTCPSKHLAEIAGVLNKLGYLSFDKINNIFFAYLMSSKEAKQKAVESSGESRGQELSTSLGFYELKRVFQLRFFKTIWNNKGNDWNKITEANEENDDKGGLLWLAQDSLRVSNFSQAESLLRTCLEKYPGDYRTYCALGFLNIEKKNYLRSEQYLGKALFCTRTKPQKIFILLLLSRFYDLAGDSNNALKKIREIKFIHPFCAEAVYQEIIFKFKQGNKDAALKQLVELIQMNREYYINALIDPDLASFNNVIHLQLKILFQENRQKAQKAVYTAEKEFLTFKNFLGKADDEIKKADAVLSKIKELALTDSYFGFLDMAHLGDFLTSTFSRVMSRRKKKLINTIKKIHRRMENIFSLTENYRSRFGSNSAYKQLKIIQSEFKQISESAEFNDFSRFLEMSGRCEEISKELDA
ncbi:MAG: hypothetical protein KOO65_04175, partial [Desulfobacterales bacterium]|nr:hypothetical protein [Desulfobacterales bacterium]